MLGSLPFHSSAWVGTTTPLGPSIQPRIDVEIKAMDDDWQPFDMKLDSGSAITFMNADDCAILGYPLTAGQHCQWEGVEHTKLDAYAYKLDMRIGNRIFNRIRVAFWADESRTTDRLFGVMDIFRQLQIGMRANVGRNYFTLE